ncbi:MAG: tyrosine-type recombinase/integrase [Planctomycetaceae bacterium]|nr:tyrosine-type recombinase/integrase [Planctomycetaceae bacterium]
MNHSTNRASRGKRNPSKPEKPYKGFPLFAHDSGRWAKKIRRKLHFFGRWANTVAGTLVQVDDVGASAQAALEKLNREWPYLMEGRTPPPVDTRAGVSLRDVCNAFLTSKRNKLQAGELEQRTFRDYYRSCELLIGSIGKHRALEDLRPDDFEKLRAVMARRFGPVALKNEITRCRMVFKFAFDQGLIDTLIRYGQSFDPPSAKTMRKARQQGGKRMFEADEILRILAAADPVLKAMILLGVNCGFGNTDIASLTIDAVDLDAGWVDFPRPKTAIERRIPLWPETVKRLRVALAQRPEPAHEQDGDLCFLTGTGRRWVRSQTKRGSDSIVIVDPLSQRFTRLLRSLKINGRRGLGFFALRHVFETIGGESRDQVAVNAIMGHVDESMAGVYREQISDERLQAVTDVVRAWLFSRVSRNGSTIPFSTRTA